MSRASKKKQWSEGKSHEVQHKDGVKSRAGHYKCILWKRGANRTQEKAKRKVNEETRITQKKNLDREIWRSAVDMNRC